MNIVGRALDWKAVVWNFHPSFVTLKSLALFWMHSFFCVALLDTVLGPSKILDCSSIDGINDTAGKMVKE